MATTKKTNNAMNNGNVTKVICQNCGAEIIIPNHEHSVAGVAIGKNSGLGTVVLPTVGGSCGCSNSSPVEQLASLTGGNAEMLHTIANLIGKIEESGYLDVDGIVRRWIPSQCLEMFYAKGGFHKALQERGYDYSWKVLMDEMKKQAKLYVKKDIEGYVERNRWYNRQVAVEMAKDYIDALHAFVGMLKTHSHKGRMYKQLKCSFMNNGKGVHIDELPMLWKKLEDACNKIGSTKTPATLYDAVARFNNIRIMIKFSPRNRQMSGAFINAYKAAGSYYTIKDLIMFEDCLMQLDTNGTTNEPSYYTARRGNARHFVEKEESLAALESKASEIAKAGSAVDGYMMLGLLRDFLQYNKFDLETTKKKWTEQSEIRKAFRGTKRGERRSRK